MNSRTVDNDQPDAILGVNANFERSPPKSRLQILRFRNLRISENGKDLKTGPPYTAGPSAMKQDSLLPRSGRIPRDSARNIVPVPCEWPMNDGFCPVREMTKSTMAGRS